MGFEVEDTAYFLVAMLIESREFNGEMKHSLDALPVEFRLGSWKRYWDDLFINDNSAPDANQVEVVHMQAKSVVRKA